MKLNPGMGFFFVLIVSDSVGFTYGFVVESLRDFGCAFRRFFNFSLPKGASR